MKMQYTCTNSIFIFINITAESLNFVGGGQFSWIAYILQVRGDVISFIFLYIYKNMSTLIY